MTGDTSSSPLDPPPGETLDRIAALHERRFESFIAAIWQAAGWATNTPSTDSQIDLLATRHNHQNGQPVTSHHAIRIRQASPERAFDAGVLKPLDSHPEPEITDVFVTTAWLTNTALDRGDDRDIILVDAGDFRDFVAGKPLAPSVSPESPRGLLAEFIDIPEDTFSGEAKRPNLRSPHVFTDQPVTTNSAIARALSFPSRLLARVVGRPLPGTRSSSQPVRWISRLWWTLVVGAVFLGLVVGLLSTMVVVRRALPVVLSSLLGPPIPSNCSVEAVGHVVMQGVAGGFEMGQIGNLLDEA